MSQWDFDAECALELERVEAQQHQSSEEGLDQRAVDTFGLILKKPQTEAISHIVDKKDVMVFLPTGYGKSLIFQIGGFISHPFQHRVSQFSLVISPLRSIILDQVEKMKILSEKSGNTLKALEFPSSEEKPVVAKEALKELEIFCSMLDDPATKPRSLVGFLTPDKLSSSSHIQLLVRRLAGQNRLFAVFVDEAHSWATWARDFRPLMKCVRQLRRQNVFGDAPLVALTATADDKTKEEIKLLLGFRHEVFYSEALELLSGKPPGIRPNLRYKVVKTDPKPKSEVVVMVKDFILENYGASSPGIVFCLTKADANEMALTLRLADLRAEAYHSDVKSADRDRMQTHWLAIDDPSVMILCATSCFSMGVDKQEVRFVVHLGSPRSLPDYVQESGRAGRNGEPADSIVFYASSDLGRIVSMSDGSSKLPKDIKKIVDNKKKKNKNGPTPAMATEPDNSLVALSEKHRLKEYQWFSKLRKDAVYRLMHVLTDVVVCRRVNLRYVKRFQDLGDSDNVADLNGLLESNCFTSNPLQLPCDNCYRLRSLKPGLNDINGKEYVVEDRNVSNEMKRIVMCINEIVQCTVLESLYEDEHFPDPEIRIQRHQLELYQIINVFLKNETKTVKFLQLNRHRLFNISKHFTSNGKPFYDAEKAERLFRWMLDAGVLKEKIGYHQCNIRHWWDDLRTGTDEYDSTDVPYYYVDVGDRYKNVVDVDAVIPADICIKFVSEPKKKKRPREGSTESTGEGRHRTRGKSNETKKGLAQKRTVEIHNKEVLEDLVASLCVEIYDPLTNPQVLLGNDVVATIAAVLPVTKEELLNIPNFPAHFVDRIGDHITGKCRELRKLTRP